MRASQHLGRRWYAQDWYHPGIKPLKGLAGMVDVTMARSHATPRGEERERETYEKFPNELVHAEPRRQRVSSGSQLATVNTPWSRSSG